MDSHSKKISSLPHTCGVYLYKDASNTIIYIGKAIDIQKRVRQYFIRKEELSPKTLRLVEHIHSIECITTISEFDALLLEAQLISKYQPKYNMIAKDDKSPIYINIPLAERLPIITLGRKSNNAIGPFQSTRIAKQILSTLRKIIPFCSQKIRKGTPCFWTHLGLCHPCPSDIMTYTIDLQKKCIREYRNNIYLLKKVLLGQSVWVRKKLETMMFQHATRGHFEQAALLRNQIQHLDALLQTHFDPHVYTTTSEDIKETIDNELNDLHHVLSPYYPSIQSLDRIECIDISQTKGKDAVGSLVALDRGIINTNLYRKFSIRNIEGQNDTKMIQQVMTRRSHHTEWPFPNLLIVDGGKGQLAAAISVNTMSVPIIGLAKRFDHIVIQSSHGIKELPIPLTRPAMHIIQRIRDESHRFAHSYHVLKRKKAFISKI